MRFPNIWPQKLKEGKWKGNDHLIEFHLTFSVYQNFLLNKAFDQNFFFFFFTWSNFTWSFQLIKTFINVILSYFKLSINCQNLQVLFWQLIKSSNNGILGFLSTFDQLPKSMGSFLAVDRMYCWLRNRAKN